MSNLPPKYVKPALRLAATAALLAYLALTLDLRALTHTLTGLDAGCWATAVALYAASQLVSSYRWARLARAAGFVESDAQAAGHYFAGAFVNLALPTSLGGDALRALRLARRGGLNDRILAGCTVAVDRVAGLSALLLLGAVGLLAVRQGWGSGALAGLALAAFGLHALGAGMASRLAPRSSDRSPGPQRFLAPYVEQPRVLAAAAALSWVVQLLNIATVVWLGAALGLRIPLATYFAAVPAVAVLAILPLSISGLGAREVGLAMLLPVTAEQAASLGLLWFSVVLTTGAAGGLPLALARGDRAAQPHASPRFTPAATASRGLPTRILVP